MFKKPQKTDKKSENTKNLDKQKSKKIKLQLPKNKKMAILLIALVVFGAISLITVGYILMKNNKETSTDIVDYTNPSAEEYAKNNEPNVYAIKGDEKTALSITNKSIDNAKDDDSKVKAYNQQANVYVILKNYSNARDSAKKAIAIKNNGQSWIIIAQIAEINNDYKVAVEAYKKALEVTPKSTDGRSDYAAYNGYLLMAEAKL